MAVCVCVAVSSSTRANPAVTPAKLNAQSSSAPSSEVALGLHGAPVDAIAEGGAAVRGFGGRRQVAALGSVAMPACVAIRAICIL